MTSASGARTLDCSSRPPATPVWAGVDVGGRRKGFHAAVVDGRRVVAGPRRLGEPRDVATWLLGWKPRLVAIDSPSCLAREGATMREGERQFLAAGICGIRPTPNREALQRQKRGPNPTYYEWIERGLELYKALEKEKLATIECFPTAAWTQWGGRRGRRRRSRWSQAALDGLGLLDAPARPNQDHRDAIAAAMTACEHEAGRTDCFGDIVVPKRRPPHEG